MKALLLYKIQKVDQSATPLYLKDISKPEPGSGEIRLRVLVCGVCHTELDEIEGRTPPGQFPVVLGHQVVGVVDKTGEGAHRYKKGARLGVAWIFSACGTCEYCRRGEENLCADFKATGRDANGGYAEYMVIPERFAYAIPENLEDGAAAPLLCAGAIGYRSLRLTGLSNGQTLGLTGFGASAHLVLKAVRHKYPDTDVFVFARNPNERKFALELGAKWAGDTDEQAPELLDAIIDTTPAWKPVMEALKNLKPAGRLVINAIRKEDADKDLLLKLQYEDHLWMEKEIKTVANVARRDVEEFLQLAGEIPLQPDYTEYPMENANEALQELKAGKIRGAKVLRIAYSEH